MKCTKRKKNIQEEEKYLERGELETKETFEFILLVSFTRVYFINNVSNLILSSYLFIFLDLVDKLGTIL